MYYLSRNGHLEHPHFMEVALSSPEGLYLRGTYVYRLRAHAWCFVLFCTEPERPVTRVADVIDRLDALRGKGMARMYSWASKRLVNLMLV